MPTSNIDRIAKEGARFDKRVNSWELYDLQKDPNEMHNLCKEGSTKKDSSE